MNTSFILIIVVLIISVPILALVLGFRHKIQNNKIREMELQKEILELEITKQNNTIKLLEEEQKKLDKIIEDQGSPGDR